MTIAELRQLLNQLKISTKYRAFEEGQAPKLPYLLYYEDNDDGTLKADNFNYAPVKNMILELYTDDKDLSLEERLENILNENRIEFDSEEVYIESEQMFEKYYSITI